LVREAAKVQAGSDLRSNGSVIPIPPQRLRKANTTGFGKATQ
jgi:hypothetical protein